MFQRRYDNAIVRMYVNYHVAPPCDDTSAASLKGRATCAIVSRPYFGVKVGRSEIETNVCVDPSSQELGSRLMCVWILPHRSR